MNIVEKLQRETQNKNLTQEHNVQNVYTASKLQYQQDYQKNKSSLSNDIKQDIKRIALKYPSFEKYALYRIYKQFDFNREIANEFISIQIQREEQVTKEDEWIEVTSRRRALLIKFQKNANTTQYRSQSLPRKNDTIGQERSFSHERRNLINNSKHSNQPLKSHNFCPYEPKEDSKIIRQRSKSPYIELRTKSPQNHTTTYNRLKQRIIYEPKQLSTTQQPVKYSPIQVKNKEKSKEKPNRQIKQFEYVRKDEQNLNQSQKQQQQLLQQQQQQQSQEEKQKQEQEQEQQRILKEQQKEQIRHQEEQSRLKEEQIKASLKKQDQIKEQQRQLEQIAEQQRQQEIIIEQQKQDDLLRESQRQQEVMLEQQIQQQSYQYQYQSLDMSQKNYPQQFIGQQFVEYPQYPVYSQNLNQLQTYNLLLSYLGPQE